MSIRKTALENDAFVQMKEIYDNRILAAKRWKEKGKKVAGVLGCDVPDEILIAADILPYRIFGEPDMNLQDADKYLEFSFPPIVRSQFEKVIAGTDKDYMDYLIISNSTDAMTRIYFYIKEVRALEPEKQIPEVYFIDWLFTKYRMHQVWNEDVINRFKKQVEKWIGRELTAEEIKKASAICNRNRELLEEMAFLRRECRITGTEALVIIGAGIYMDKEEHSELLVKLLADAKSWPVTDMKKIYLTGTAHEQTDFYELLEDAGATVVSEDHDFGDRHWNKATDTRIDPVKAIVDRYMLRSSGTKRSFTSERVEVVCEGIRESRAAGFISYTHIYDEAPSWDFPEQKKAMDDMGIPALQLARQNYAVNENENLKESIKSFVEQI